MIQAADDTLGAKALAIWNALERQYTTKLSEAQRDLLFASYVYGLTLPFYGHVEPESHLDACRVLLTLALAPQRAEQALNSAVPTTDEWLERAARSMESIGARDARSLVEARMTHSAGEPIDLGDRPPDDTMKLGESEPG